MTHSNDRSAHVMAQLRLAPAGSPQRTLYQLIHEVSRGRNLNTLRSIVAPTVVDYNPLAGQGPTFEEFILSFDRVLRAFPDLQVDLVDAAISENGAVFCMLSESGTLAEPLGEMTRTGCFLRWKGLAHIVIRHGLIQGFMSISTLHEEYQRHWKEAEK